MCQSTLVLQFFLNAQLLFASSYKIIRDFDQIGKAQSMTIDAN